jgi:hypothetical protein
MTEKKKELTAQQQYHLALHAMPSAIAFNATVSYGKTKFEYVDFKALRDAVLPILDIYDLSAHYSSIPLDGAAWLTGAIVHKNGETLNTFGLPLRAAGKPQDLGSEITYFKRYALAALCGIVSDKDDDGNFADKAQAEREAQEKKEKWKGPIKKHELKTQLRAFNTDIVSVEDSGSMHELMNQSKAIRDQCEIDLPDWFVPMEAVIDKAAKRVEGK